MRRASAILGLLLLAGCPPVTSSGGGNGGGAGSGDGSGGGSGPPVFTRDAGAGDPGNPGDPGDPLDLGSARDAGGRREAPDLAPVVCLPACGPNQVCNGGVCQTLPNSCPCPMGAYCDVASNTCRPGCLADGDCQAGTYCDTTRRSCAPGCRTADDCANQADACIGHACSNSCGTCDDRNACTQDSCVRNVCRHSPVSDGSVCGSESNPCLADTCSAGKCVSGAVADGSACPDDGNVCTSDVCLRGGCTHPAVSDGTACPDDGNVCTSDVCAAGSCAHPPGNEDEPCGYDADYAQEYCHAGTCADPISSCDCSGGYCFLYDSGPDAGVVDSCSCAATELLYTPGSGTSCNSCTSRDGLYFVCW
jgi:hypothetical protein